MPKNIVVCPSVPIVVGLSSQVRIAGLGQDGSGLYRDDERERMWKPSVTSVVCDSHFVNVNVY